MADPRQTLRKMQKVPARAQAEVLERVEKVVWRNSRVVSNL